MAIMASSQRVWLVDDSSFVFKSSTSWLGVAGRGSEFSEGISVVSADVSDAGAARVSASGATEFPLSLSRRRFELELSYHSSSLSDVSVKDEGRSPAR